MPVDNLAQYDSCRTFRDCIVITVPGQEGFIWIESGGTVHISGMKHNLHYADVQILYDSETGEVSHGWLPR